MGTRYISNIEMPGGTVRYVPLQPPKHGGTKTSSAADWTIDMGELEKAINPKTRMIVRFNLLQLLIHRLTVPLQVLNSPYAFIVSSSELLII